MKKFCIDNWKTFVVLIIVGFSMTAMWVPPWERPVNVFLRIGSFMTLVWILLWLGNSYTSNLVSGWISWTDKPVLRFVVGVVVMVVYTLLALWLALMFFNDVLGMQLRMQVSDMASSTLVITLIISLFMHGRAFLQEWKTAELNLAQLQKESIRAQYDSLKSQVNPHFLFNSLNALTNLIYEDQDKAAQFVKQLSEVYRYVLDTQNREVVALADELRFLRSYLFLQQIRFGDKLKIEIDLDPSGAEVAPLVLQMLVENAIKHNIISNDQPLTIRVFKHNEQVVVENNIQKKSVLPEESKGIGLENIKRRYSFLSQQPIEVINDGILFTVKLPAL